MGGSTGGSACSCLASTGTIACRSRMFARRLDTRHCTACIHEQVEASDGKFTLIGAVTGTRDDAKVETNPSYIAGVGNGVVPASCAPKALHATVTKLKRRVVASAWCALCIQRVGAMHTSERQPEVELTELVTIVCITV